MRACGTIFQTCALSRSWERRSPAGRYCPPMRRISKKPLVSLVNSSSPAIHVLERCQERNALDLEPNGYHPPRNQKELPKIGALGNQSSAFCAESDSAENSGHILYCAAALIRCNMARQKSAKHSQSHMPFLATIGFLLASLVCSLPNFGQQSPSVDEKLPHGLRIPAVLDTTLSSHKSQVGDPV